MKSLMILVVGSLYSAHLYASPAVLIEDGNRPTSQVTRSVSNRFSSTLDLKEKRRVGVGIQGAGALGVGGALVELNYTGEDTATVGFGGGPRYRTLSFSWKSIFSASAMSPYFSLGYARWYNSTTGGGAVGNSMPSLLSERFLSDEEKASGVFGKDFVVPALGIQYNQLNGPYAGTALFAEVLLMIQLESFKPSPTGALGMIYYF